jgi:hypothetical protein
LPAWIDKRDRDHRFAHFWFGDGVRRGICGDIDARSARWLALRRRIAPPAPRVVIVPAPRPGRIWAPGYWRWTGGAYVWIDGAWIVERPGFVYAPSHWARFPGGWRFIAGGWARRPL